METRSRSERTWAIVLAGGEGLRLRSLTRLVCGRDLPKQFVPLVGTRSLLQSTLDRIAPRFHAQRTLVVVGEAHRELARRQLADYPCVELVVQPANRGTAPGILFPLARIRARDPNARAAIFPSDHFIARPAPLFDGIEEALGSSDESSATVVGVEPDHAETDFGWIVPGVTITPHSSWVRRFVEKPGHSAALRLFREGALWNTFITIGRVKSMWSLIRSALPETARLFEIYSGAVGQIDEQAVIEAVYAQARAADFSRDVLERGDKLAVVRVQGSGWNDLGTPERVLRALRGTPDHDRLVLTSLVHLASLSPSIPNGSSASIP